MFNSNEVLIYLSDYRFAIFIRIAVQINTKAFLSAQFVRELGKTGNNETKNNAKKKDNNNRSEGQRNGPLENWTNSETPNLQEVVKV